MLQNRYLVRQIHDSQDMLLKRFIHDKQFARVMAAHPLHACLSRYLPLVGGQRVLELGCGPGKYVALLSTLGFQVVGVDPISFPTWDLLRKETNAQLLEKVVAEDLPFPDQSFDHVICLGALLYFDDPPKAMSEIRRVIKPGGHVIIRTVNKTNPYTLRTGKKLDPASKHLYTLADLQKLIENCGFRVSSTFQYGFWPPFATDYWWYLICVWIPISIQHFLSSLLRPENRVNNTVVAVRPV